MSAEEQEDPIPLRELGEVSCLVLVVDMSDKVAG